MDKMEYPLDVEQINVLLEKTEYEVIAGVYCLKTKNNTDTDWMMRIYGKVYFASSKYQSQWGEIESGSPRLIKAGSNQFFYLDNGLGMYNTIRVVHGPCEIYGFDKIKQEK